VSFQASELVHGTGCSLMLRVYFEGVSGLPLALGSCGYITFGFFSISFFFIYTFSRNFTEAGSDCNVIILRYEYSEAQF
jgi:hypothetical protein